MDSSQDLIDLTDEKCETKSPEESVLPKEEKNVQPNVEMKMDSEDNLKDNKDLPTESKKENNSQSAVETQKDSVNLMGERATAAASSESKLKTDESPKLVVEDLRTESKKEASTDEGEEKLRPKDEEEANDTLKGEPTTADSSKSELKSAESQQLDDKAADSPTESELKAEEASIKEQALQLEDVVTDVAHMSSLNAADLCVIYPTSQQELVPPPELPKNKPSRDEYVETLQQILTSKYEKIAALGAEIVGLKETVEDRDGEIALLEGEQVHLEATVATFKNKVRELRSVMDKLEKYRRYPLK